MPSSYTYSTGGGFIQPSNVSFREYTLENSIELVWPSSFTNNPNVATSLMNIAANKGGLHLTLPSAREVSVGQNIMMFNIGKHPVEIQTSGGKKLLEIKSTQSVYIYLTNNKTDAGEWSQIPFGVGNVVVSYVGATSDDSKVLEITGSPIETQGTLSFKVAALLKSLVKIAGNGMTVLKQGTWLTRTLQGGNQITVTNPDGQDGNPTIALKDPLTVNQLTAGTATITSLTVNQPIGGAGAVIPDNAVTTPKIADSAVTAVKVANGAITTDKIPNASVTGAKLVNQTVTATQIANKTVTTAQIADNAVTAAQIANGAVTADKIPNANVTGAKLVNQTITSAQIANQAVSTAQIANSAVTTAQIANNSVTSDKIPNTSVTGAKLVNQTVTATQIAPLTITGAQIANGSVTADKINIAALSQSFVPTGCAMPFAAANAPAGWLLCNGQAVSRVTYAALFAVIGVSYGAGDGNTTFNVPDLRGRSVFGFVGGSENGLITAATADKLGLGGKGGKETHVLTVDEIPSHSHVFDTYTGSGTDQGAGFVYGKYYSGRITQNTGGGQAHANMPPFLLMNFIIKA